ncbi:cytochrome b5 domain-containing protein [Levilactobacillus namurensis]|uniref:cytochrome b5 domain-containing protein n=1 Tax=Levilactobacillus namurensis TaxID=380393 RepID=UPI00222E8C5C|nr:cytochrome b5 domain-containing protein [Levilactobacillus namurensis]MCW3779072.1 cytochrome B5 [Levilactobacillus namurensis]MDT7019944.1 cytochrome b5 domain-containing protein [Levilactobacillus namurensis]WNN65477.1 cytochrome b5 domain-containing protein [Levilactobacillus namurensis]
MAEKNFTIAELSQFDGQNGHPAYVAVDGTVYDVSNVDAWAGGQHHGNVAGKNLSAAILKSPHGKGVLQKLPVMGTLTE